MKIGPKYKIAKRLGPAVFEKTQTQKYAISKSKKKSEGFSKPKSAFAVQMLEKQKVRFSYALSAKQLQNYAKTAIAQKTVSPADSLFSQLESRIDSIVTRAGFAPTKLMAKQIVSHGHIRLNEKRVNVPSLKTKVGDVISIRPQSLKKALFAELEKRIENTPSYSWLKIDLKKAEIKIVGIPHQDRNVMPFNLLKVIEFYKR